MIKEMNRGGEEGGKATVFLSRIRQVLRTARVGTALFIVLLGG